jgi:DNA transformation protein
VPRRSAAKPQPDIVRRFLALTTPIGAVEAKPMFGGYGFYLEGVIFALEFDGQIWLKMDKETRARFEEAGCRPFVYQGQHRPVEMPYWTLPAEAARGGAALKRWVGLSLDVARRAAERKRATVRRRPQQPPDFI